MLNFVKCFFCIYWDDCIIFTFHSIIMVYHIHRFGNVEPFLHSRMNPTYYGLWSIYCAFEFIFLIFCWEFFNSMSQGFCSEVFFSCSVLIWLWYLDNVCLVKWVWESSFPSVFWMRWQTIGINSLNASPVRPSGLVIFLVGKFLIIELSLLTHNLSVWMFYFFII